MFDSESQSARAGYNRVRTGYRTGTEWVQTGYNWVHDWVHQNVTFKCIIWLLGTTGYRLSTDWVQTGYRLGTRWVPSVCVFCFARLLSFFMFVVVRRCLVRRCVCSSVLVCRCCVRRVFLVGVVRRVRDRLVSRVFVCLRCLNDPN